MKQKLGIIITVAIATACGLISKYESNQHSVYAKILTDDDKRMIRETGEIFKEIEFNDIPRNSFLKGRLRILSTDNEGIFNFVEVGEWIDHSRYGNSGSMNNVEFRDTIVYDNNGNTTSRKLYDKKYGKFQLTNNWTGGVTDGSFVQNMKVYDKGLLIAEYSRKIVNHLTPRSDLQKTKIPFGSDKEYHDGKLLRIKTYDSYGKLISDERYVR